MPQYHPSPAHPAPAAAGAGSANICTRRRREESRLLVATEVLDELRSQRDDVIPAAPAAACLRGGGDPRRHEGGALCRRTLWQRRPGRARRNGHFTDPVFVSVTGLSGGFQFGAQSTDIVLVFTTRRGLEGLAGGKLTLGAGASVAARARGPPRGGSGGPGCGGVLLLAQPRPVRRRVAGGHRNHHRQPGQRPLLQASRRAGLRDHERRGHQGLRECSSLPVRPSLRAPGRPPPRRPARRLRRQPAPTRRTRRRPVGVRTFPMEDQKPGNEPH